MTPDSKSQLSKTIRTLRTTLLDDLHGETERVYRLAIKGNEAGLNHALLVKRQRLEAWLDEQVRAEAVRGKLQRTRDDFRRDVEKQAAYTLLNRLVFLRLLEAFGQRSPHLVTGGWDSLGYKNFREVAPALVRNDETEGYAFLLKLVFEDLAIDLPGLYGPAGMAELIPIPAKTLRALVDAFDDQELESCWTDDMTLGWIYQYWNDPEREALDAKINGGGKIEPHEIASKTQMFTERYMVDWLLQNSLGPIWLAMCRKHGWTPAVEADGTLDRLEQRREEWRAKRDAGDVSLTELMPLRTNAEQRWAYYVTQPIPQDAIDHAPQSVRELKILDPAVGSGHFLVVAFDLLFALYQEEAQHRGEDNEERWSDQAIVEQILGHNLHGIDLDPRAVQIAAAALWLKGRLTCAEAQPEQLNLVASNLRLASLPDDDPALVELRRVVEDEIGIPATLTDEIVHALRGADHLGSLLKVDAAVEDAIGRHESQIRQAGNLMQKRMFDDEVVHQRTLQFPRDELKASVLDRLENFLSQHTGGNDLGLRLRGEQLTVGVRFVRMMREGTYDLVVANPPYQGTSKLRDTTWYENHFPLAKTDLFAGMTMRALQLLRPSGVCAMIALSNWMFVKAFLKFRTHVLSYHLSALADLGKAAFTSGGTLISTACYIIRNAKDQEFHSFAIRPMSPAEVKRDAAQPRRTEAGLLLQRGRHIFVPAALKAVPDWPLVYWWSRSFLNKYATSPKLETVCPACSTQGLYNNVRFTRLPHEVSVQSLRTIPNARDTVHQWVPFVDGSAGAVWFEPLQSVANWGVFGIEPKCYVSALTSTEVFRYANEQHFFRTGGIAFATIGSVFNARAIVHTGIFGNLGRSLFPASFDDTLCGLNSNVSQQIMESLNPTIHFTVGGVNRLPLFPVESSDKIIASVSAAFHLHESHREASVEFKRAGPSPWRHAQDWARSAVDRREDAPLPEYNLQFDPEPPTDHLSFALGVAMGRFSASGEGILDPTCQTRGFDLRTSGISEEPQTVSDVGDFRDLLATAPLDEVLPAGILFLDGTLGANDRRDGLGHRAANLLLETWSKYGTEIASRSTLRQYLSDKFFEAVHRKMYENRPIHWPLSSEKKTFVAWVTIHRWNESTLRVLLADYLQPTLTRLEGELTDLRIARDGADKRAAKDAEKRFGDVLKSRDELAVFIKQIEQCAEKGPLPTDAACPPREVDARYIPDLDDGVMINSAALWPLLAPQWKDPKKWWKELATGKGKKDYDWSHLAMKYWPARVDAKCQQDPSLGVAHGCFWKYHPARAWAWELRLQDEIGADFRIQEAPYREDGGDVPLRAAFLRDHPLEAIAAIEKELLRRRRKQKSSQARLSLLEAGLWSTVPEQIWDLELRLSSRQGVEFRLLAPDEPAARSAFEQAHPGLVKARKQLIASMAPVAELFPDDDDEAVADDDESDEIENEEGDE